MAAKKKAKKTRPVVPGDPAKDEAVKEWLAQGKKLLGASMWKNYDRKTCLDLYTFLAKAAVDANRHTVYRVEQATKGPNR